MGIPVPGETALIAAALLAHRRPDGRRHADRARGDRGDPRRQRRLRDRPPLRAAAVPGPRPAAQRTAHKVLELGEPFFAKHGPKAVFLGRWVAGLRIASAWLAGMNRMRWPTFLFWNALGGIVWATSIALCDLLPRRRRRARDRRSSGPIAAAGRRRGAGRASGSTGAGGARSTRARPAPAATASRPAPARRRSRPAARRVAAAPNSA